MSTTPPRPTADELRAIIRQVISEITGLQPDQIPDAAPFDQIGVDSLTAAEVMVHVDYKYQLRIPPEEVATIRKLDDAVVVVQRYLN
jgi:acyl carrier protein